MPISTYQETFEISSLTPAGLQLTISPLSDVGATDSRLPPTTGQLWPRINQK